MISEYQSHALYSCTPEYSLPCSECGEDAWIHDFYGFPGLYKIRYPAVGSPDLTGKVADLILLAGIRCDSDLHRRLDHGAWVPLMLMFPDADIPVVQLSIQHHMDPVQHLNLGRSIHSLRDEGVLIIGSGGAVHPLGFAEPSLDEGAETDGWAKKFDDWSRCMQLPQEIRRV